MLIRVYGTPVPQGSMKAFVRGGRAQITSANNNLKPWREAIKSAVDDVFATKGQYTYEGPVEVKINFWLPKPKSTPKKVIYPAKKPDLDKLIRGVFDALTEASVWKDDSLVVCVYARKLFADEFNRMGCSIDVWSAEL